MPKSKNVAKLTDAEAIKKLFPKRVVDSAKAIANKGRAQRRG